MATNQDIVGSALLNLLEVHHDRRQAELDLERAQAKEKFAGRSAIPGVFAQLQEQEVKRQKQRASAEKARQAGAPTPAQLTPPPVDVTGMPTGAGSGVGRKILGEALEGIAGGGNLKRAGAAGAVANQTGPMQQGISLGAGQMGPPPQPGIRVGQGAPGEFVPVTQELTGGQRAASVAAGVLRRDPFGVLAGVTGEREIDVIQLPTAAEQAAPLANDLAIYQRRMTDPDPATAMQATELFTAGVERIRGELGDEIADAAQMRASSLVLAQEEQERLKALDPEVKAKRDLARVKSKQIEVGNAGLTQGERDALKTEQKGLGDVTVKILQPATVTELERKSREHLTLTSRVTSIDNLSYPEYFTAEERAEVAGIELVLRSSTARAQLTPQQVEQMTTRVTRMRDLDQAFSVLTVDVVRPAAGATMAPHEVTMLTGQIPMPGDLFETVQSKSANFRHLIALDTFRDLTMRAKGLSADPSQAMEFGEAGILAQEAYLKRVEDLESKAKLSPQAAEAQAAREFREAYGMDTQRLFASPSGL